MKVRRLLSLDLATRIGLAWGDIGQEPEYSAHRLDSTGEDLGAWLRSFDAFLAEKIFTAEELGGVCPDMIVYEAPVLPRTTGLMVIRKLNALPCFLEWRARDMPIREINNSQVKKFWTGKGNAKKPDMVAAARRWGYDLDDKQEDEADALAGWWFTVDTLAPQLTKRFHTGEGGRVNST